MTNNSVGKSGDDHIGNRTYDHTVNLADGHIGNDTYEHILGIPFITM